MNKGMKVMIELCCPWANSDWIVVGDSYFASVQTAQELKEIGLWFVGVVKTATKGFSCMIYKRLKVTTRLCGTSIMMTSATTPNAI